MNKLFHILTSFTVVILFFIQLAGTLVESIYILDLLNTRLDEKALGVLFFFGPLLFFPVFNRFPRRLAIGMAVVLLITRGMLPYLTTANRVLASGLGIAAALTLLFLFLSARPKGEVLPRTGLWGMAGLGLAVELSVFLRTWGHGLDYSLLPDGGWLGWILALLLAEGVTQLEWNIPERNNRVSVTGPVIGMILLLTLFWFSFSAPSVIARWTEGNYTLIVMAISLLTAGCVWVCLFRPQWLERIGSRLILVWNILFTLSLTGTLLVQRVPYPPTPDSAPMVMSSPTLLVRIFLLTMLTLFPVLFLDMRLFLKRIQSAGPTPQDLVPGFVLGTLIMVILIFINIFSNVWGYVPPVSPMFRGTFWLSYFLLAGTITLLAWLLRREVQPVGPFPIRQVHWAWGMLLVLLVIGIAVRAVPSAHLQVETTDQASLTVMTFNTQQSNDDRGERSFEQQLELMKRVAPDIIALQESDSARISLNNNDYIRYFAERLGYYSYYGPTPVTGTYGTAILSKHPLLDSRTIFTYSDTDEIGTAEVEIEVGGQRFTIYNVHPAGSDAAMLAFARSLLERAQDDPNVIALGDYNLRDYEEAYSLIDSELKNAWTTVYPSEVSPVGVDMSGENRIDHIFVSPRLDIRNPVYVLPPESATDHPIHWAEIVWEYP